MWTHSRSSARPLAFVSFLLVMLMATVAAAAGRIQWAKTTVKEREGGNWRLEVKIFMPRAPNVPHVPVKFEFEPIAYYERSMVDGDKLLERRVPLSNHQAMIEGVDIGFLDPGSGKIEPRTKFTFKVTRAHGYEAGEYKVTIRDGRNGQVIGRPTTLKFEGENEIIDRRTMVFADKGAKKKKKDDDKKDDETKTDDPDKTAPIEGPDPEESTEPDTTAGPEPSASDDPPQEIKDKPGGCGCRTQDLPSSPSTPVLPAALVGLALLLRRRRRA